jgi:hypothetical protein
MTEMLPKSAGETSDSTKSVAEETFVSKELQAEINEAGATVATHGAAGVDQAVGLGAFVKPLEKPVTIEDLVSDKTLFYLNNPDAAPGDYEAMQRGEDIYSNGQKSAKTTRKARKTSYSSKKMESYGLNTRAEEEDEVENESRLGRLGRALGRIALSPVRGVRKVNELAAIANVEVLSRIPGLDSREEKIAKMLARQEKYTIRENDSRWTRIKKHVGRNAFKASAWAMPTFMATAAAGMLASKGMHYFGYEGLFAEHIPFENLPYKHTVSSVNLIMGGHWQSDPNDGYTQMLTDAGVLRSNAENDPGIVKLEWSAEMGGVVGDQIPMDASDAQGAAVMTNAIDNADGAPVNVVVFSQGTQAMARSLWEIANNSPDGRIPDNVNVIMMGGPTGLDGLSQSPVNQGPVGGVLHALGLELIPNLPPGGNITYRTDIADAFGNGGHQSLLKEGEMIMGQGHRPVGPGNAVLISRRIGPDGRTYEIWGDPQGINDPILRTLRDAGVPITPQAQALADAILPYTPAEAQHPNYGNAQDVTDKLSPALESYTGNTGAATRAVNAVMGNPGKMQDMQSMLDLEAVPDLLADAQAHPENAAADLQNAGARIQNGINTGQKYLSNPNREIIDPANDALAANGLPRLIPHFQPPRANASVAGSTGVRTTPIQAVPVRASAPIAAETGVTTTPIQVPDIPPPTPANIQRGFQQAGAFLNNLLAAAGRR